jgi:hypothetical protein
MNTSNKVIQIHHNLKFLIDHLSLKLLTFILIRNFQYIQYIYIYIYIYIYNPLSYLQIN